MQNSQIPQNCPQIWKDENPVSDKEFGESHGHSIATQGSFEFDPDSFSEVFLQFKSL